MGTLSDFAIVSLSEIKAFLGLTDADTARDAWLETEINRTTEQLERFLDRRVRARLYREDLDEDYESRTYYLDNTPVIEVQNLYRDKDRRFDTDALIADTEYAVYDDRVELALSYGYYGYGYGYGNYSGRRLISSLLKTVRVEYVAGWGRIEIPFSRQRIDLTEESGGDQLTFYLNAGVKTPAEIVDALNIELNTAGDNTRTVSFDWKSRAFTITQEDGDLELITSETNNFADTDSALPLLGFTDSNTYDSSPATGDTITLDIPNDIKRVALDLIANRWDMNRGNNRRGLRSRTIGNYSETFGDASGTSAATATMPFSAEVMEILTQYRRWTIV
jgi:hypothetical protein